MRRHRRKQRHLQTASERAWRQGSQGRDGVTGATTTADMPHVGLMKKVGDSTDRDAISDDAERGEAGVPGGGGGEDEGSEDNDDDDHRLEGDSKARHVTVLDKVTTPIPRVDMHLKRVRSPDYFRTQYLSNLGIWANSHARQQLMTSGSGKDEEHGGDNDDDDGAGGKRCVFFFSEFVFNYKKGV